MTTPQFDFEIGEVVCNKAGGSNHVIREKLIVFTKVGNLEDYNIEYRCVDANGNSNTYMQTDLVKSKARIKGFSPH